MTEQVRRSARLVAIEELLRRNPNGLTTRELAERTRFSSRTIQRDLGVLGTELGVPLMDAEGRRYRLMPGSTPIGAVRFTLQEARAIYLATRQFSRRANDPDPDALTAMEKLASALPLVIAAHVEDAVRELRERPSRSEHTEVLRNLTVAWAESRSVAIRYRSQSSRTVHVTGLDPYLLEPSPDGAATYVIGFSHEHEEIRTYKLDRILAASLSTDTFVATGIDELKQQLRNSWGVVIADEEYDVVVEFTPEVARRVRETNWHSSQRLTKLEGGGVRLELHLPSLLEFIPWVLSWGAEALVVVPKELRERVAASLSAGASQYATG
ncbi:MAG: WYL domain-containing transcriptional regulator [Chloroflexi bacterium]|nr:WYL domain-containing transcriptional regulator [Chloroflexota bacterium]